MSKRILVVEDDIIIQDLMARRLKRMEYDVLVASNGLEGIKIAHLEVPDLILMDMRLPLLDGWEATRRLKASLETCNIPVIALTAQTLEEDQQKCLEVGCDDYVGKPVNFASLLEKIEMLLASHNMV